MRYEIQYFFLSRFRESDSIKIRPKGGKRMGAIRNGIGKDSKLIECNVKIQNKLRQVRK